MVCAGTSWEGVQWKQRLDDRTEFGQSLKLAARDLSKRHMMMMFVALFPVIAAFIIALASSPASAGSCFVDTVPPTHRYKSPSALGIAYCSKAGGHSHYLWVKLMKDTWGYPNDTVSSTGKWSSRGNFSDQVAGWAGSGWYYTYAGVRFQDDQASGGVYWG